MDREILVGNQLHSAEVNIGDDTAHLLLVCDELRGRGDEVPGRPCPYGALDLATDGHPVELLPHYLQQTDSD